MKFNYERLFAAIKENGITYTYVASQIGMTRQNLTRIKNGKKELSATQVVIICEMIRSPLDMFVTKE